jgi:hypothetical protein
VAFVRVLTLHDEYLGTVTADCVMQVAIFVVNAPVCDRLL